MAFGLLQGVQLALGVAGGLTGSGGGSAMDPAMRAQLAALDARNQLYKKTDFDAMQAKEAELIRRTTARNSALAVSNYFAGQAQQGHDSGKYDTAATQAGAQAAFDAELAGDQVLADLPRRYLGLKASLLPNASDYDGAIRAAAQHDALDEHERQNKLGALTQLGGALDAAFKKGPKANPIVGGGAQSDKLRKALSAGFGVLGRG